MSQSYAAPESLEEALALLAELGSQGVVLAGGMAIVPAVKSGMLSGKCVVNIKNTRMAAEPQLDAAQNRVTIGALVRHRDIERSSMIAAHLPCLAELEQNLASVQIRNHGTLVGNLCAAEPLTDPPCLVAALDAQLTLATSVATRTASADDWVVGPMATKLRPGELLTRIDIPLPACREGAGYARLALRQGLARPLVCAAARIRLGEDSRIAAARVFVGAIGPRPQRMIGVEALMLDNVVSSRLWPDIDDTVHREIESAADARCAVAYKQQIAGVLVRRAIAGAVTHANRRREE